MRKFLAVGVVGMLAASAQAGFSTGPHNGINSASAVGAAGSANSPAIVHNHAGPAFIPGSFTVSGTLTEVHTGTFAREARFRVTSPGGQIYNSGQHTAVGDYGPSASPPSANTVVVGPNTQNLPAAFVNAGPGNSVGNWSFAPHESFDDGGAAAIDQTWTDLNLSINDFVPPTPPPHTNLGNIVVNDSLKHSASIDVDGETDWYAVTLTAPGGIVASTAKTFAIGANRNPDTEIALYNSLGALLAQNDDIAFPTNPYSRVSVSGLAAGTYYVAVAGYNRVFAAGFSATDGSEGGLPAGLGQYWLNVTPEPASLALLGLGALAIVRRRR